MNCNDKITIRANRCVWADKIELRAGVERKNGLWSIAQSLVFEDQKEVGDVVIPFINLHTEEAQALMDELWRCGLRPTEGSGSAGAMAATQKHLEDMRTLVFSKEK